MIYLGIYNEIYQDIDNKIYSSCDNKPRGLQRHESSFFSFYLFFSHAMHPDHRLALCPLFPTPSYSLAHIYYWYSTSLQKTVGLHKIYNEHGIGGNNTSYTATWLAARSTSLTPKTKEPRLCPAASVYTGLARSDLEKPGVQPQQASVFQRLGPTRPLQLWKLNL